MWVIIPNLLSLLTLPNHPSEFREVSEVREIPNSTFLKLSKKPSSRRIASEGYTDTQPRSMQFCGDLPLLSPSLMRTIALPNEVYSAVDAHVGAW